jgi:hypothetical protein
VQPAHPVRGLQHPLEECTRPHARLGVRRGKEASKRNVAISDCPYRFTKLLCRRQFNAYAKVASTILSFGFARLAAVRQKRRGAAVAGVKIKNYGLFGGAVGGAGGVLGVKRCVGVWCVFFMAGKSPTMVGLIPLSGMFDCCCCGAGTGCAAGTKGCDGVWCVRFMLSTGVGIGLFDSGAFLGVFI